MRRASIRYIGRSDVRRSDEAQTDRCVMHFNSGASAAGFEFLSKQNI
jgi:hypothetical protein